MRCDEFQIIFKLTELADRVDVGYEEKDIYSRRAQRL